MVFVVAPLDQVDVKDVELISRVSPALWRTPTASRGGRYHQVEYEIYAAPKCQWECLARSGDLDKGRGVHRYSSTRHKVASCGTNVG